MLNSSIKKFIMCLIVLLMILSIFSCSNKAIISDATDSGDNSNVSTESLTQITIGIEAYKNIDKSYLDDNTYTNDTKTDNSENTNTIEEEATENAPTIDEETFEDGDTTGNDLDSDNGINDNENHETTEATKKAPRKRFIDIEYDTLDPIIEKKVYMNKECEFATYSEINNGFATLYIVNKKVVPNYKGKVVAVNAGHGTKGGSRKRTYSHPDFTPKVSGGSTKEGAIFSYAISDGMVFLNGMLESTANLMVANALKEKLLSDGYSVLMMREDDNTRLDNIARVVIANENADCHISIHFDSTNRDKGIFYVKPINNKDYLNMEPLKSNVDNINRLGMCLLEAYKEKGEKLWRDVGILEGDLTQLSYSTNASVDIELGDRATFVDEARAQVLADGLLLGIQKYFQLVP